MRSDHRRRALLGSLLPDDNNPQLIAERVFSRARLELKDFNPNEPRDPHSGKWTDLGSSVPIAVGGRVDITSGAIDPISGKPMNGTFRGTVVRLSDAAVLINAGSKKRPKWVQAPRSNARTVERAKPRTGVGPGRRGYFERLTKQEVAAIDAYKGYGYKRINGQLRAGKAGGDAVRQLDAAVRKGSLGGDTRLYRSFHITKMLKPGDVITDRGFASTSTRREVAERFTKIGASKRALVRINAPAGLPAAFLPGQNEDEVLLGRNSSFVVQSIRIERGVTVIDVKVVTNAT